MNRNEYLILIEIIIRIFHRMIHVNTMTIFKFLRFRSVENVVGIGSSHVSSITYKFDFLGI